MDWIKCIASRLRRAGCRQAGVTLIETVAAIALFGIVSTSLITMLTSATAADGLARQRSIADELAQQQVEYVRQLGYVNAGVCYQFSGTTCISSGNPAGIVLSTQSKRVMGLWYTLSTTIKWVNDPIPAGFVTDANYKRVRVIVSRASDGKVLSNVTTYLSSSTRDPLVGLNNAIINVTAKDYLTQDSLGGVTISLSKPPSTFSASDTTDNTTGLPSFGQVTFAALEPTDASEYYNILASLSGYAMLKDDLPSNDTSHSTSSLALAPSDTKNTTLRLYKPCTIYVRVIDQSTGNPYSGTATVTISSPRGAETFTTTNGLVSIGPAETHNTLAGEPVVPGTGYSITVDTPNFRHGELTGQTVPDDYQHNDLSSSFDVTLATVPVPQDADLTVIVRHTSNPACWGYGTLLSGAAVTISDPSQSPPLTLGPKNTNSSGQVVFSTIPLGTYDIKVSYKDSWHTRTGGLSGQPLTEDTTFCVPLSY